MSDFPACTLPQAALNDRIEEIRAIGAASLVAAVSETELRFRADGETRRRLEDLIRAEAECCEGVSMRLEAAGDHLALHVTGPGSQAFHRAFTSA
ncbi:MAG: hypothetical protein QOE65_450 [Solirubrobacteraceae bacterium]|nr:hypothetical protein [Solirubrobacteraceae bacterium]